MDRFREYLLDVDGGKTSTKSAEDIIKKVLRLGQQVNGGAATAEGLVDAVKLKSNYMRPHLDNKTLKVGTIRNHLCALQKFCEFLNEVDHDLKELAVKMATKCSKWRMSMRDDSRVEALEYRAQEEGNITYFMLLVILY